MGYFLLIAAIGLLYYFWPRKISEEVRIIGEDMVDNNLNWRQSSDHYFTNGRVRIWTANGVISINFYPKGSGEKGFTWSEKIYLSRQIKKSRLKTTLETLKE